MAKFGHDIQILDEGLAGGVVEPSRHGYRTTQRPQAGWLLNACSTVSRMIAEQSDNVDGFEDFDEEDFDDNFDDDFEEEAEDEYEFEHSHEGELPTIQSQGKSATPCDVDNKADKSKADKPKDGDKK